MSIPTNVRAVAYYRMSTDRQEDSIEQQRDWVNRVTQREGLQVVAEFEDPGIAGDEIKLRPGLQALLDRCEEGGVDAVVTWNADRFSRADSIRTAALLCRLLDAGVTRMLTAEGWIDFEDDTDRMLHAIRQDASRSAYSKTLSANVARALVKKAREGKWNGGRVPYAYVVGPDQHLALGDPAEVEAVRTIFQLLAAGLHVAQVARELDRLGAPLPKYGSKKWTKPTVYGIATNRKYTGAMDYGNLHQGKYNECSGQGPRRRRRAPKTAGGRLRQVKAAPEDVVMVENAHSAIVDRELWERVQRTLAANCMMFRPGEPQPKRRSHKWPLSGLAYCRTCGHRMYGVVAPAKGGRKVAVRRYVCGAYVVYGRNGCSNNWVNEDHLLPLVFDAVRHALSNPEGIRSVREAIEGEIGRGVRATAGKARALRRQPDELGDKARQGLEKIALLPADLVEDMAGQVRHWKEERERLTAEAARLEEAEARAADEQRGVDEAMEVFQQLGAWLAESDEGVLPAKVKAEALATLVDRVELRFEPCEKGTTKTRRRTHCTEFTVHFRPVTGLLDRLNVDVLQRSPAASR